MKLLCQASLCVDVRAWPSGADLSEKSPPGVHIFMYLHVCGVVIKNKLFLDVDYLFHRMV